MHVPHVCRVTLRRSRSHCACPSPLVTSCCPTHTIPASSSSCSLWCTYPPPLSSIDLHNPLKTIPPTHVHHTTILRCTSADLVQLADTDGPVSESDRWPSLAPLDLRLSSALFCLFVSFHLTCFLPSSSSSPVLASPPVFAVVLHHPKSLHTPPHLLYLLYAICFLLPGYFFVPSPSSTAYIHTPIVEHHLLSADPDTTSRPFSIDFQPLRVTHTFLNTSRLTYRTGHRRSSADVHSDLWPCYRCRPKNSMNETPTATEVVGGCCE